MSQVYCVDENKGPGHDRSSGGGGGQEVTRALFLELQELIQTGDQVQWKQSARWIKYVEDVEPGGHRWSKPHVGTLPLHSLLDARRLLAQEEATALILNMAAQNLAQISNQLTDILISSNQLDFNLKNQLMDTLLAPHRHVYQNRGSIASKMGCGGGGSSRGQRSDNYYNNSEFSSAAMENKVLLRKISPEAEACNILVGGRDFFTKIVAAFIRLEEPVILDGVTEIRIPTRFLFILLGPMESSRHHHKIGRAMATLLSDPSFLQVAYTAEGRKSILDGVDYFLDSATLIPPSKWDPATRIEPPVTHFSHEEEGPSDHDEHEEHHHDDGTAKDEEDEKLEQILRQESGLVRTGKLFGGLINDFKRKRPWYWSDFKDAMSVQCVASWIYLYIACLTPIITFGGLLGKATHRKMAAVESLVSGFICGIGYGFFSGQPLTILGSTGPILVFEQVLDEICDRYDLDYLELRCWIGLWVGIILIILIALDASAFVSYITRFTEENFATLVALIFVVEAFKNVYEINTHYPIDPSTVDVNGSSCHCKPSDLSYQDWTQNDSIPSTVTMEECDEAPLNGSLVGGGCNFYSNVYLMSILLFLGTFSVSILLKKFKSSAFFSSNVRQFLGDFAVIIAVVAMTCLDLFSGLDTPKLHVPENFEPTLPSRGWLIEPFGKNPPWTVLATIFPALLATILIFMDQQITAVIVNRKEYKLKKGCGYHLDLLVLAFLIIICSFMGIPWFAAATVQAITHVESLKMESECCAPGEKPQFLGVREQRVTQIMISVMIGLSVTMTPLLKHIPMPVLYGVFLYMGFTGLQAMQLFDRILLIFMPSKYQPDYKFLRHLPIFRIHLYTSIQLACLAMLWLIKSFPTTSILFPLMLVVMIVVRKLLDKVFSQQELKFLDEIMPKSTKPPASSTAEAEVRKKNFLDFENNLIISEALDRKHDKPLQNGNHLMIPLLNRDHSLQLAGGMNDQSMSKVSRQSV